jgi:vitamin K-dependent gamma-carboxylase
MFKTVDIKGIVYFRIAFGVVVAVDMLVMLLKGVVNSLWVLPEFHFKYFGFGWVPDVPVGLVVPLWCVAIVCAVGIALGLFYRVCAVGFFILYFWFFLADQSWYLNQTYLVCLLAFLAIFIPAANAFSMDCLRRPTMRKAFAPAWCLWILRFQIAVVYVFGGLAKLNADWLFRGEPLRTWLALKKDTPLIGGLLESAPSPYAFAWGGVFFDLLIVPTLMWKRTRVLAFLLAIAFHVTNGFLFKIGIFPWLMIAMMVIFFPFKSAGESYSLKKVTLVVLAAFIALQSLMPLRHFLYAGDVLWTEEGHRFSWRMMLRSKPAKCRFFVYREGSDEPEKVYPEEFMLAEQARRMALRPDLILQAAQFLGRRYEAGVRVYAKVKASLNGRAAQYLIDPKVDLMQVSRNLGHADWIVPLQEK